MIIEEGPTNTVALKTKKVSRLALLSVLKKLKIKFSKTGTLARATKKLARHLKKEPDALSALKLKKKEVRTLAALGHALDGAKAGKTKKKSKKGTIVKAPKGNTGFIQKLLKKGKTKDEIKALFHKRYSVTGRDEKFINRRFNIYYALAEGKKGKKTVVKKSSKGGKKGKSSKEEAPAKTGKKKGKVSKPEKKGGKKKKAKADEEE